jgi:hypothetical protein
MKPILKSYRELCMKDYDGAMKLVRTFGDALKEKGWNDYPIEGGYLSPCASTLFIYGRDPYYGQLLQFSREGEADYQKIVDELMASGEFMDMNEGRD